MDFGKKISIQRKLKRFTQSYVADYLHISTSTLSNYENNIHEPDLDTLVKLATLFEVSTDYLLGRTQNSCDFTILEQNISGELTVGEFLNATQSFSDEELQYLVKTVELLMNQK